MVGLLRRLRQARALRAACRRIEASALFDASYYLLNAADVEAAGIDPLRHFCADGWRENRRPNLYFEPAWYGARYLCDKPDRNPLLHYIEEGERRGCRPVPFFDPVWYRTAYELDVGVSPLAHFLSHRRTQRVAPVRHFDLAFYLDRHASEIGRNRDPFMHHVRNGAAGRDLDPSATFDAARYRREVMAGDVRSWTGLFAHEMRVPLIHLLEGLRLPTEP